MTCDELQRNLDAYIDDELDVDAAGEARDHVRGCTACRRRVDEREALGRLVRSAPYYSAPQQLRTSVVAQTTRSTSVRRLFTWAAAAVLVTAVGSGIALLRSATVRRDAMVDEVVDAHVRSLQADHLFDVQSSDQHTVKPWFLGKLDFSPPVVDLGPAGFPLVGGRLDYVGGRPVAALVYLRHKHAINLFVSAADAARPATAVQSIRGFHVHCWIQNAMSFWAVSDVNDVELTQFVHILQRS